MKPPRRLDGESPERSANRKVRWLSELCSHPAIWAGVDRAWLSASGFSEPHWSECPPCMDRCHLSSPDSSSHRAARNHVLTGQRAGAAAYVPGTSKAPVPGGAEAGGVHLREINENKLETLLALRADVLARAGEQLANEGASQASAQATPPTAHQPSCDEVPTKGTTLANQTVESVDTGARQRPAPLPHSVTGDSLEVPASGDSEPPTSDGLAKPAPSPIRAKTDANAVARTIMQRQHHLTAAERDEVARLYQDGLPVRTICERFGISKDVVYGIRRRRGLPRRRAGMTDEQKVQAVELRARGVSAAAIGRQFGVNVKTVLAYLRAAGSDQTRQ